MIFIYLCWRRTSLELGTVRAETKRKNNQFARTSLRNKIKQLVRNQLRSRTQENCRGSINLIYIHIDFLKPLFNCATRDYTRIKNKEITVFPQEPFSLLFLSIQDNLNSPMVMDLQSSFDFLLFVLYNWMPLFCFPEIAHFLYQSQTSN